MIKTYTTVTEATRRAAITPSARVFVRHIPRAPFVEYAVSTTMPLGEWLQVDWAAALDLRAAAAILKMAYSSLAEAIREGRLQGWRVGRTWLTTRAALDEAIQAGGIQPDRLRR